MPGSTAEDSDVTGQVYILGIVSFELIKSSSGGPGQCGSVGRVLSAKQLVTGSIPSQGSYLGFGFDPQSGHMQEATDRYFPLISMFVSLCFSLLSPLSKNK